MYTVVIAEQEHLDNFKEYALFLKPFIDKTQFALCQWNPSENGRVQDIVPELEAIIDQRREWRAIILCDESGIEKKNPFQQVEYHPPVWEEPSYKSDADALGVKKEEEKQLTQQEVSQRMKNVMQDYFDRRWEAKQAAYDEAAEQPLVRLVTMLCEDPVVTQKGEQEAEMKASEFSDEEVLLLKKENYREELEYLEYRKSARYKQKLRQEIRGEEARAFSAPSKILCIAMRHHEDMDYELSCVWNKHDETEYSRFYDWNLYFDKMRYLVFDIEDKKQLSYRSDYIRFLTAVCVLAAHDEPSGSLQPHRVYQLVCQQDKQNMQMMLGRYFAKLDATKGVVQEKIRKIRETEAEEMQDTTVERVFCHPLTIPVDMNLDYKKEDLFSNQKIGLSSNCPVDREETVWMSGYGRNRKAVKKLLKQPARAVKRATDVFRGLTVFSDDRAAILTEFQADDVQEYVDQEELGMVDTHTNNIYDLQHYYDQMEAAQTQVHKEIDRRMRRFPTILWGVLTLLMVSLCMIPVFLANRGSDERMIRLAQMLGILLLCLILVGIVCLLVHRWYLTHQIEQYNHTMSGILQQVESDTEAYSAYLSHACNFMRGTSVLDYYQAHKDGSYQKTRKLEKHIMDMDQRKAEVSDIYRSFMMGADQNTSYDETAYDYNFDRAIDYAYPIQPMPDLNERIEFLEKGNYIDIPYGVIRDVSLRREELYD